MRNLSNDATVFAINKNVLPYGRVKVQLMITYNGNIENLHELSAKDETWFDVKSTPLSAAIRGKSKNILETLDEKPNLKNQ